ncbi:MAG: hypothetical protein ACHQNE_04720 [Candidatus Kapaibacterium sp.]
MNARLIFLAFILILATSARANAQGIDSTQWPFPDTLGFMSDLFGTIRDTLNQIDNSHDIIRKEDIPGTYEAYPSPKYFTWHDAVVDSNEWHFQADGQIAENNLITLDIELDTARKKISLWHYHHSIADMFSIEGTTDIQVSDINYSHSALSFPDNDLYRHLYLPYLSYDGGHSDARWYYTLVELDSFSIWGQTLVPAFQAPNDVDFGLLSIGTNDDTLLKMKNVSNAPLIITGYTLSDPDTGFTLFDTSLHIIPANDSGVIIVRFKPRIGKPYSGSILISTDEPYSNGYRINLGGGGPYTKLMLTAYAGYSSASFRVTVGNTEKAYLKLFNLGTIATSINALFVNDSTAFSVDSPEVLFVLDANDSSLVIIGFHPRTIEHFETTLNAQSLGGNTAQIGLIGDALPPSRVAGNVADLNEELSIVPIIASESIRVNWVGLLQSGTLVIRDILGKEICVKKLSVYSNNSIAVYTWPNGTYFAELLLPDKILQARFIIQH